MNEDIEYAHSAIDPFWRWHETLTVFEATALVCGHEPSEVRRRLGDTYLEKAYPRFGVVNSVLGKALRKGDIKGSNMPLTEVVWDNTHEIENSTDTDRSEIDRDSLIAWLRSKGHTTGFFFPDTNTTDMPGYLDPDNPRYAPKLAAAVKAWEAMSDPELIGKLKPKDALNRWLEVNYKALGLVHNKSSLKDGYEIGGMSKSAVTAVAEFANWETAGTPPKTPSTEPTPQPG